MVNTTVESLCKEYNIDVQVNSLGGIKVTVPVGVPTAVWMAVAEDWRNRGHLGSIWLIDGDGQTAWVGQITRQDGIVLG